VRRGQSSTETTGVTSANGYVFADLGFSPEEAENLKVRAQLMNEIRDLIGELTQIDAAGLLGVSQPRVSDLKRGKIGLFTIDALVNMLAHAGVKMRLSVKRPRKSVT
jgi:predicted XRE-type DNA-binding protein